MTELWNDGQAVNTIPRQLRLWEGFNNKCYLGLAISL